MDPSAPTSTSPLVSPAPVPQPVSDTFNVVIKSTESERKNGIWPWFIGIGVFLLVVGGLIWGILAVINGKKNEVKVAMNQQVEVFNKLEVGMGEIVSLFKSEEGARSEKTNAVVLGLEDDEQMKKQRRMMELFKSGREDLKRLGEAADRIKKQAEGPLVVFLPKERPFDRTKEFVSKLDKQYEYFEKETDLAIRSNALAFNLGMALQLVMDSPDEVSIKRLEASLNELKDLVKEEKVISTGGLPEKLQELHKNSVSQSEKIIGHISAVPNQIRNKDLTGLQESFINFFIDSTAQVAKQSTDMVSYWQRDETIRSIGEVRREWQDFSKKL